MNNIKETIRQLARGGRQSVSLVCTVDAVDRTARTVDCTPLDESAPLLGVNLQANQGSTFGVVTFPKVGSYVVVGFVADGAAGVVLLTDEVESVEVAISGDTARISADREGVRVAVGDDTSAELAGGRAGIAVRDTTVEITPEGVIINGGGLGGLVKVEALTEKLNGLIEAFNSHTHEIPAGVVAVAGSATAQSNPAPITVPPVTSGHPNVSRGDYENEKVKHG